MYGGKYLDDNDNLSKVVQHDSTLHLCNKILAGPACQRSESIKVYYGDETDDYIVVNYAPNDRIGYIAQVVIEILVHHNLLDENITIGDIHLKLRNKVLDLWRDTAEYKELAPSYFTYHLQEEFINKDSIFSKLIKKFGTYYQTVILGNRSTTDEQLRLYVGKSDSVPENYNCIVCNKQYNVLLPCCRERICYSCVDKAFHNDKCPSCSNSFN